LKLDSIAETLPLPQLLIGLCWKWSISRNSPTSNNIGMENFELAHEETEKEKVRTKVRKGDDSP